MSNTKRSGAVLPTLPMHFLSKLSNWDLKVGNTCSQKSTFKIRFSVRNQICNTTFLLVINLESSSSKDRMIYRTKGFLKGEMMNYSSVAENQIRVLNSIYFSAI